MAAVTVAVDKTRWGEMAKEEYESEAEVRCALRARARACVRVGERAATHRRRMRPTTRLWLRMTRWPRPQSVRVGRR